MEPPEKRKKKKKPMEQRRQGVAHAPGRNRWERHGCKGFLVSVEELLKPDIVECAGLLGAPLRDVLFTIGQLVSLSLPFTIWKPFVMGINGNCRHRVSNGRMVKQRGCTRIPVFHGQRLVGICLVQDLLVVRVQLAEVVEFSSQPDRAP